MVPCGPVLIFEKKGGGRGDLKSVKIQENVLDSGYVFKYENITYAEKTDWTVKGN